MPCRIAVRLLLSAVTVLLACAYVAAGQAEPEPVGLVDEIAGAWVINQGRKSLHRGDLLLSSQTVRFVGTSSGRLSVLRLDSGTVWTKTCSDGPSCSGSFRPVDLKETPGFWSFLTRYWTSDRELSTVFARTRSVGPRGPVHGFAVFSDDRADLTPLVAALEPGTYHAAFLPAPGAAPSTIQVERDARLVLVPGKPVLLPLPPGLYSMTISSPAGQIGSTVVVFVAPIGHPAATAWRDARIKAEGLELTPEATNVLLARILYALHSN